MDDPCKIYKSQFRRAKETLDLLEQQKAQIDFKLKSNAICSTLHKELRTVNLDIKITLNEIEYIESNLQECELQYSTINA